MRVHWLWLDMLPKITLAQKRMLLEVFSDPEEIFNANADAYKKLSGMTQAMLEQLMNKDMSSAYKLWSACERQNIGVIACTDSGYPRRLRGLSDAPLILYYKGVLPDFEQRPLIGVVGTRSASGSGLKHAQQLGGQIAACGGIVVSGGALGIDSCALRGAYSAGMPTVTVLAGGLDRLYPKENEGFFRQLCTNGCLLSELPPGAAPYKATFLRRNRLISGMSNGVLVVEAPQHSGALNTAKWALEQGKDLFAVPGDKTAPECEGSNALLEDGAHAALSGWSVMQHYADRYPYTVRQRDFKPREMPTAQESRPTIDKKDIDKRVAPKYSVIEKKLPPLNEQEQIIVDRLRKGPELSHVIADETDMDTGTVMRLITVLSMKGVVQITPDGMVSLK